MGNVGAVAGAEEQAESGLEEEERVGPGLGDGGEGEVDVCGFDGEGVQAGHNARDESAPVALKDVSILDGNGYTNTLRTPWVA